MKTIKLIAFAILVTLCSSCNTYSVIKSHSTAKKAIANQMETMMQDYEEQRKSRPDLTFNQFLEERKDANMQREYKEALKTRPNLNYEEFKQEKSKK